MKQIIRFRGAVIAIWIVATVLLTVFSPSVNAILARRGQNPLPSDSPSIKAEELLDKMDITKGTNDILVFYDSNKISDDEMNQIEAGVKAFSDSKSELKVDGIIDPFNMPEAKTSLISKDGTTLMVSFKLDKGSRDVDDIQKDIESKFSNVKTEIYLTGQDFINNDYLKASVSGVEKSAILTVLFILIILIIMFRSVIAPFVSLLAVAFSYLCSMGITAQLIDKANFPVTTLTQISLVLILFGIGTDYNILLFNRFKEELNKGFSVQDSIINTYRTAGKTIAFSVLTVLIAFFSLIFSESPIYKSGVAVVIGAAVLLLEILTLTPCIMRVLGTKLFWPSKKAASHKESKLWGGITTFSTKHALVSVVIVTLAIASAFIFYKQKLNFDSVSELGNSYPSSKGFYIISDHFGKGQSMPVNIVIENNKAMDNNESLSVIDSLTEKIKALPGVSQVSSVTQPMGTPIDNFYVGNNMTLITGGLTQTQDGVNQINDGLKQAQDSLSSADFSKVNDMVSGTEQLKTGVDALTDGLNQIKAGINNGNDPQTIISGLTAIETNLNTMSGGIAQLSDSYTQMQAGLSQMGSNYQNMTQALLGTKGAITQMQSMITALGSSYPSIQSDQYYQTLVQTLDGLANSLSPITPDGIKQLNDNFYATVTGFKTANDNLAKMSSGLSQMSGGLKKLESGLYQADTGIGTIVTNMQSVSDGLSQMEDGQKLLVANLNGFGEFGTKLKDVNDGLQKVSDGIAQTNTYLTQLNTDKSFYIPAEALKSPDFTKSLDAFMTSDRTMTKLIVVLKDDPYSKAARETVSDINNTLTNVMKDSSLSDAKYGVAGPSAITKDMNDVLSRDLSRMIIIVLIGVFLVLLLVMRHFWIPLFITASLAGTYYAASIITNFIYIDLLHYAGISSFVPFFAFIMFVALGVDYSIFLMMRYKEYPQLSPKEAIIMAGRHIGSVVMAAVLILGGTFATLMPSGMILLMELGVYVIVGLTLLCFIMLPIFLPAMIALPDYMRGLFKKNSGTEEK